MSSYKEQLFAEVKTIFLMTNININSHTTTGTEVFLWTSQGLIPQLNDCDEVYRNIYIGNGRLAQDARTLKQMGISLVVNAAQGTHYTQVNTHAENYLQQGMAFLGVPAYDNGRFKMRPYFQPCADIMDKDLKNGGKIYVHCHQGLSRSATLVLAYLMLHQGLGLVDALNTVRLRRLVTPNDGFLRELCHLDEALRRGR